MQDTNDETIKTYQENFSKYVDRTPREVTGKNKEWIDSFILQLPLKAKIIELGSATGRDARYLKLKGFEVLCTDVIPEALENLSKEGFETSIFNFRDEPKPEWINKFDGLFANGVFVHATQDAFEKILLESSKIVKENGIVAFSLKIGEGEEVSSKKLDAPRYFKYYSKEELLKILSKFKYEILSIEYGDEDRWWCVTLRNHLS